MLRIGALLALAGLATPLASQEPAHHEHPPAHADHSQHEADLPPPEAGAPQEASQSEREHVAPDAPQQPMHEMSYREMTEIMAMDDRARIGMVMLDQLDLRDTESGSAFAWDVEAWYGDDYNKAWLKSEGERHEGDAADARVELLWDRIFSRWWSVQLGARQDVGPGPSRTWAAVGVQGLAPNFFEIEATAYFGEGGQTAARVSAEYDVLLTQRLVLQPEVELTAFGKNDLAMGVASGLSNLEAGVRLRYEIRRELAPYIGLAWTRRLGHTADLAHAAGEARSDLQLLAGLRIWF